MQISRAQANSKMVEPCRTIQFTNTSKCKNEKHLKITHTKTQFAIIGEIIYFF